MKLNRRKLCERLQSKMMHSFIFCMVLPALACTQCKTSLQFAEDLITIEKDRSLPNDRKLTNVVALKKSFEQCGLIKDSVYAKILHRLGATLFSTGKFSEGINYTIQSTEINTSPGKQNSRKFAVNSFFNLGYCYQNLHFYSQALDSYDKCIALGSEFRDSDIILRVLKARLKKGNIEFQIGDYQKDIEEMSIGLQTNVATADSSIMVELLNERAQAYSALKNIRAAVGDIEKALRYIREDDYHAYANNCKIRAVIYTADSNYQKAIAYSKKAIAYRQKTADTSTLSGDYNDAVIPLIQARLYDDAVNHLNESLKLALSAGNSVTAAKASSNLGLIHSIRQSYAAALTQYQNSLLQTVPNFKSDYELNNPTYLECNAISDKNFLALLLGNKTECLLNLYKQTGKKIYLFTTLKTARLTDSIITDVRHAQSGEQSKLYWRNETREFFTNAIEACYQAGDATAAFFFMEKSKAVLLNDKLNELGASAYLQAEDAERERTMQMKVLSLQQKLEQLRAGDPSFEGQQLKLLHAREDMEKYIKTLQYKYPAYYQYKYADDMPSLHALQNYLYANGQSFVHYFLNDSTVYMMAISSKSVKLIRLPAWSVNDELTEFLKICSDKQSLNYHYDHFTALSNKLFNTLFKPLQLPAGRVIICYDNLLIPFESLATDDHGKHFLVNDYAFSYIYSARFLLKKFRNPAGSGNFFGVAPVSYATYLGVPPLAQSQWSLDESAANFHQVKLITNADASRGNFLKLLPDYTIVTILSHARADTTDQEPVLFMSDSIIRLSELQLLHNPSTQLIVLSACQTYVGKVATGEGIISLARGFASAGIPSISATLWKADEKAIYQITETFLQNISAGMRKDDALQQAKLAFMRSGVNASALPYYWANMILAGNGEPVHLSGNKLPWIIAIGLLVVAAVVFMILRQKKML